MANTLAEYTKAVAIEIEEELEINTIHFSSLEQTYIKGCFEDGVSISYCAERIINARDSE